MNRSPCENAVQSRTAQPGLGSENVSFLLGTSSPSLANSTSSLNIVFVNSDQGLTMHLGTPVLCHLLEISLLCYHHSLEGE